MNHRTCSRALLVSSLALLAALPARADDDAPASEGNFQRVATFVVCENTSCDREQVELTAAEIVAVSADGRTLVYTDSPAKRLGFVDIRRASRPRALGALELDGEPTSIAVVDNWMLVAVDTSESFSEPAGYLGVFDLERCARQPASCTARRTLPLLGQPDSIAVSPDRRYAAIAIENQRDEEVTVDEVEGGLPQLPGGSVAVLTIGGRSLRNWSLAHHELAGLSEYAPDDPEPEHVSINEQGIVAVTLQENNHIVLVDARDGQIVADFSAGSVDLEGIDLLDDQRLVPNGSLQAVAREPDAVAWLDNHRLVTANEGDLFGGSRGFSVFDMRGRVRFDSGATLDRLALAHGHYPDGRSDAKGSEPEGIAVARYGDEQLLFVGSERGNFVAVYSLRRDDAEFRQLLPTGIGPEGMLPIPGRNLFVAASEDDEALRSTISIFELRDEPAGYPTVIADASIGWVALSALAADRTDPKRLYSAHDAALKESRLYVLDASEQPARIHEEIVLHKDGKRVDYDVEGLAQRADGSFWLASEGSGEGAEGEPNLLIDIAADGTVRAEIELPADVAALQRSSGYEGVTVTGEGEHEQVYLAFQREWEGDPAGSVRIGRYTPATAAWAFFYYPLDAVESPAGGWVGLSEVVALSDEELLILERDDQGGPDARVKRLYSVSVAGVQPATTGDSIPMLRKTLVRDLLPALKAKAGWVQEKVEGVALTADGTLYVVTDNDGVDDNTGETQLLRFCD